MFSPSQVLQDFVHQQYARFFGSVSQSWLILHRIPNVFRIISKNLLLNSLKHVRRDSSWRRKSKRKTTTEPGNQPENKKKTFQKKTSPLELIFACLREHNTHITTCHVGGFSLWWLFDQQKSHLFHQLHQTLHGTFHRFSLFRCAGWKAGPILEPTERARWSSIPGRPRPTFPPTYLSSTSPWWRLVVLKRKGLAKLTFQQNNGWGGKFQQKLQEKMLQSVPMLWATKKNKKNWENAPSITNILVDKYKQSPASIIPNRHHDPASKCVPRLVVLRSCTLKSDQRLEAEKKKKKLCWMPWNPTWVFP